MRRILIVGSTGSIGTRPADRVPRGALGRRRSPPVLQPVEPATSFAWARRPTYLYLEHRYRLRSLGIVAIGVAFALLAYASALPARIDPLIAALQNRPLLTIHVAMAIISYGAFTCAFAAGVLYLINRHGQYAFLPHPEILDEIGYKSVIIGFPAQTLLLILGAVWANVAWGAYWQWDPKETTDPVHLADLRRLPARSRFPAPAGTACAPRGCCWLASAR